MSTAVAIVGARGRVGRALVEHLDGRWSVVPVDRRVGETTDQLARRAVEGVLVVINAAGVAHVESESAAELVRLHAGNVELPLALASSALAARTHLVHVSSVKAVVDAETGYGRSKFEAEQELSRKFANQFEEEGIGLILVRPLALLLPPFDAGKLRWLRWLRGWPSVLTPPIRLPVLSSEIFVGALDAIVDDLVTGVPRPGLEVRDFPPTERGTARDVRRAMRLAARTS